MFQECLENYEIVFLQINDLYKNPKKWWQWVKKSEMRQLNQNNLDDVTGNPN